MQKITPHLWYDKQAKQAAELYCSVFQDGEITMSVELHDTPSGSVDILGVRLMGLRFEMINGGPLFPFNPAQSFMVFVSSPAKVDALWKGLSEGGQVLMPLDSYPWSERYGWTQDQFGVSWQLLYREEAIPSILPTLMFVGDNYGKAEQAMGFYASIFRDAQVKPEDISRYEEGDGDTPGLVKHARFTLAGQEFACMDSGHPHGFNFNESVSFMVDCEDQAEIDYYWSHLSAVPDAEQCGWVKDKYGVSWQIVPRAMREMMKSGDTAALGRLVKAFLAMKKFDLARLEAAFRGND